MHGPSSGFSPTSGRRTDAMLAEDAARTVIRRSDWTEDGKSLTEGRGSSGPAHGRSGVSRQRRIASACAVLLVWAIAALAAAAPDASASSFWSTAFGIDSASVRNPPGGLSDISCPTKGLCVAVDYDGNVLVSTSPTGGAGAWSSAHVDSSEKNLLSGVSCPTTGLCVAVDASGNVVTSTDPTGGASAWTTTNVDGARPLSDVSCPTSRLCVALDATGNVLTSTDPTGGASAWTIRHIDSSNDLFRLTCPTDRLCVAVGAKGKVVTSTHPTGDANQWRAIRIRNRGYNLYAVSCPTTRLCVAVDYLSGSAVTSTRPTGGARAWTAARIDNADGGPPLEDISCPTTGLCVAADLGGNVITSTRPTGGRHAWTSTFVDAGMLPHRGGLVAVSCPTASLCVAVDASGNAVSSTQPAGVPRARVSSAAVFGIARGKPRVMFTASQARTGPLIKSIAVEVPSGMSFRKQRPRVTKGIVVKGSRAKRLNFTSTVRGRTLTITLKAVAPKAQVRIESPAIAVSKRLICKINHKRIKILSLRVETTDARGAKSRFTLKLKPR